MKKNIVLFLSLCMATSLWAQREKTLDPFQIMEQQMREMQERMNRIMQQQMNFARDSSGRNLQDGFSFRFFNDGSGWKNLDSLGNGMFQQDTTITDEQGNRLSFKFFGQQDAKRSEEMLQQLGRENKQLLERLRQQNFPMPNHSAPRKDPAREDKKKKYNMQTL